MRATSRSPSPRGPRTGGANRRWKEQWGTWVTRSTIIAVVVHAILLLTWPVWNISARFSEDRAEFIQLEWLPFYGAFSAPEGSPNAALPNIDALEPLPEVGLEESESSDDDVLEMLAERLTTLAYAPAITDPSPRLDGDDSRYAPSDRLILDRLSAHVPQIQLPSATLPWPLLRNPMGVTRFLVSRGGAAESLSDATRIVSVAMWIDEKGSVEWAEVFHSSGVDAFDDAALSMFREVAVFAPARDRGAAMPVSVVISVLF
jgi:TonB family protein